MTLDNEQDRQMLLDIIANANFSGKAVFVIAELVGKIQAAPISEHQTVGKPRESDGAEAA